MIRLFVIMDKEKKVAKEMNDILVELRKFLDCSDSGNIAKVRDSFEKVREYCIKKSLNESHFYKSLYVWLHCVRCKNNYGDIFLECRHSYCKACFNEVLKKYCEFGGNNEHCKSYRKPICVYPNCGCEIEVKKYLYLYRDLKLTGVCESCLGLNFEVCKNCQQEFDKCYFFYACNHVCVFCTAFGLSQGEQGCAYCQCDETSDAFDRNLPNLVCCICGSKKYVEEFFSSPCPGHIHCLNCLQVAWSINKCLKCKCSLTPNLSNIYEHLYKKCEYCDNFVITNFIVPKSCCSPLVCFNCQQQSSECVFCSSEIEHFLIDKLNNNTI